MTTKEIKKINKEINALISAKRVREALEKIRLIASKQRYYMLNEVASSIEDTYKLMLHYLSNGSADPQRDDMYTKLLASLYDLLDTLTLQLEKEENPSLYYGTIRLFDTAPKEGRIRSLLKRYADAADDMSIFSMIADNSQQSSPQVRQRELENLQSDIFTSIWATPTLTTDDREAIQDVFQGQSFSPEFKSHIVSALMMANLQRVDMAKIDLLLTAYATTAEIRTQGAALVALLMSLWRNADRPLTKSVQAHLDSVKDTEHWLSDLRIATIELIRARDTERVNRKIANEVIPEMLNLRPEILNKLNKEQLDAADLASLQENPEWQEMLDKNGITDKLKEISELQMEGSDVMMSTFAHLKSFPFFNNISNWFLPYAANHTAVADEVKKLGVTSEMIENATFLCDSDKYSFMMAISHVPESQRNLMTSQFQAQSESIYEAMSESAQAPHNHAMQKATNQYVQNIYRFFKLYRRKEEFDDPFAEGINLITVPTLAYDFTDVDLLEVIAEFYLKLGYWQDALDVMSRMEQIVPFDMQEPQFLQKIGYCYERLGSLQQAVKYYELSDMVGGDSNWTLKRLVAVHRALGNKQEVKKYANKLYSRSPEDLSVTMMLGYAMLDLEDYDEAAHLFYKVEFLDEKSTRAWRPLAWTLFLTRDFEGSKKYFDKILLDNPTSTDYLNMGHLALATGQIRDAVNNYLLALQEGMKVDAFHKALKDDTAALRSVGVDTAIIPLIADAVEYKY